jgi:hydroxymethylbilane synthase
MSNIIRIGTRDSELALWQAKTVQQKLEALGYKTQLVPVKSTGDIILDKPLYELGITGVFTKTLDIAMLTGQVDIAVHSMKDVPTILPNGIVKAAVLERANIHDIIVYKDKSALENKNATIATGSLRRKSQWLHKYPTHQVVDLRGNVNSRLQKLANNAWEGAIFAQAGLDRINLKPENHIQLDWMIPAPAQGAMLVVALEKDTEIQNAVAQLNHQPSDIATHIERDFLRTLEGGCTAPIGAIANIKNEQIEFTGALFSLDGTQKISIEKSVAIDSFSNFGKMCAEELLKNGGATLMKTIKEALASK